MRDNKAEMEATIQKEKSVAATPVMVEIKMNLRTEMSIIPATIAIEEMVASMVMAIILRVLMTKEAIAFMIRRMIIILKTIMTNIMIMNILIQRFPMIIMMEKVTTDIRDTTMVMDNLKEIVVRETMEVLVDMVAA